MKEVWKAIPGYEGGYEVSDRGRVRSIDRCVAYGASHKMPNGYTMLRRGVVLSPGRVEGYPQVMLGKGHNWLVHRLVSLAFLGPCPKGKEVRHLDGSRDNNRLSNLAYGTRSDNIRDAVAHGSWHSEARKAGWAKGPATRRARAHK